MSVSLPPLHGFRLASPSIRWGRVVHLPNRQISPRELFAPELRRTPLWRSSQNPPYTTLGELRHYWFMSLWGRPTELFAPIMESASSSVSSSCFWSQRLPTSSLVHQ